MTHVRDACQLRVNAYRVLLKRGRDGAVIFVQPLPGARSAGLELADLVDYLGAGLVILPKE